MGKVKNLKLEPGDLIVSLDDEEVGILIKRIEASSYLSKKTKSKVWSWEIEWVKGGSRARSIWGTQSHKEEDLLEDIKAGYWLLYRGVSN